MLIYGVDPPLERVKTRGGETVRTVGCDGSDTSGDRGELLEKGDLDLDLEEGIALA